MRAAQRTPVRAWPLLLVGLTLVVPACKATEITDSPVAIASISVSTSAITLKAGTSTTVSAVARSSSNKSLTARTIQWTTSDPSVAVVDANGQVTAVSPGTAMLTASAESRSATITVTVTPADFVVNINNLLRSPISITLNGAMVGNVNAQSTASFTIPGATTVAMSWQLVRPVTSANIPIGEQIGGDFSPIAAGSDTTFDYEIDNEIGASTYMAVFITNNATVRLLVGVNFGLPSENRCNCLASTGGVESYFGYYELFSNSNVRGYAEGSNYTGGFVETAQPSIDAIIESGSGTVSLVNNITPSGPVLTARRGGGISSSAVRTRALDRPVHRDDHLPSGR